MINWLEGLAISIIILMFFYFFLVLKDKLKLRKLRKKYDEKKDKSRRENQELGDPKFRTGSIAKAELNSAGLSKLERRELLQTAVPKSVRKNRKSSRGIFGKLRRR